MGRLQTLKPRLQTLGGGTMKTLPRIGATPRQRGSGWMKRRACWLREHPLCVECEKLGLVTAATEVDHVVALADGGADDDSNLQSLCGDCHKVKTARENSARGRGG
ncbi:HNH endonuclease signature motif containing protein [Aromatoleum evansii]|uniref:HNH endonuclease signature motif containing protein n=1 Tax=Aromatoleum evansii TaxID=59406 RepID=A0ABZ1AR35_AROEV|nr:HNH endonuclease signature motif containing protein [Aromatoleum evansii]WRL48348.1 HNH endonuclease signature motif containing protein [Aromatoleum evansii]